MLRIYRTSFMSLAAMMWVTTVWAEQPGQEPNAPAGQPGSGFVPEAGYLRTLQALAIQRNLVPAPMFNLAPTLVNPVSGTRLIPVICVQFPNRAPRFTTAQHRGALFDPLGPRPNPPLPTLTQYYRDISLSRFTPNGEVFGWFTMPNNDSYYEGGNNGRNQRMGELLRSALDQTDAGVDFGRFDNDGPDGQPNSGDDDGIADTVFFIHPEIGGEIGNGVNGNIWSHSWQYSKYAGHGGRAYVTNDRRRDSFGQPTSNPDGSPAFIRVEDYTIQPGLAGNSTPAQPRIIEVGVFCHEYGHALGLPDLYDRPNTGPNSSGIGHYCLMAGGSYGADDNHPQTPVHMSAWCKAALGWADVRPIIANGTVALEPVQAGNLIYNFDVPGTGGREFFLVEHRAPNWNPNPTTQLNWDSGFNPDGLAIWHVDENVGRDSPSWPFAPEGQGQNDAPSLPGMPTPSFTTPHAMVALMQADKQLHLEHGVGRGESGDLHGTGSDFEDDVACLCGSRAYNGQATGFSLRGINLASGQGIASVTDFPPGQVVANSPAPNPVAGAPQTPAAAVNKEMMASIRDLQPLARKLANPGVANLSDADRKRIASASLPQLTLSFARSELDDAIKIAAAERTVVVDDQFVTHSSVEVAAKALADRSEKKAALVRFAPSDRVEKISRLAIPTEGRTPTDDAAYRVSRDDTVKALIGLDVTLLPDKKQDALTANSGSVRYSQVIKVNGQDIPLSSYGVTFRYRDGHLTEIDSDVLTPSDLRVTGAPDALSEKDATAILANQVGLPETRIVDARRCVFLLNGQPNQARSVVRLKVDSGGKRPPIEVFLDQETRKVLQIR